jgi:peptidoglycan hydrolase-like protein with peptidoglycan-binding domain
MSDADDYNAAELAAGRLTPTHITTLVRAFQASREDVDVDGKAGPSTRAILNALAPKPPATSLPQSLDEQLAQAGRQAILNAASWWQRDIYDPAADDKSVAANASRKAIDLMIQTGLRWTWEPPYAGDGSFEWCGAFAALCWNGIRASLRRDFYASTYRLDRYASYQPIENAQNPRPTQGPYRQIVYLDEKSRSLPFTPREGDIILIGPAGSGYGKHICLVEKYDAVKRVFHTYEGNGTGTGPNGERQHGVIRGIRALDGSGWHVRRLIRPSALDLGL